MIFEPSTAADIRENDGASGAIQDLRQFVQGLGGASVPLMKPAEYGFGDVRLR